MKNKLNIKITDVAYHRNGVYGTGFYVVKFDWKDGNDNRHMVATVFDKTTAQCPVAVLDVDMLAAGNITFGENSWRGDNFAPELYKAIERYEKEAYLNCFAGAGL